MGSISNPLSITSGASIFEENPRQKAIFLDRDGTLNEDPGYLSHPDQLKLFPGVGEALARLKTNGYLLIVVSNQSGVGRGLIDEANLSKIHARLDELLRPSAVDIDAYRLCLHRPDENCDCRKPRPKLLLDAAREFQIDLTRSYMIGDKTSDLVVGQVAGCRGSILVRTGEGQKTESQIQENQAIFVADTLGQATDWILNPKSVSS